MMRKGFMLICIALLFAGCAVDREESQGGAAFYIVESANTPPVDSDVTGTGAGSDSSYQGTDGSSSGDQGSSTGGDDSSTGNGNDYESDFDGDEQPDRETGSDAEVTDSEISEGDDPVDPSSMPDLEGTWAQLMYFTADSKPPLIPATKSWTTTLLLFTQTQDGNKLSIDSEVCYINVVNAQDDLLALQTPQTFTDALPVIKKEATLTKKADGTISYYQPKIWELRSVDLANPEDALPTDQNDERVLDWDNDGYPGLTIYMKGLASGGVYLVQKNWTILEGEVVDEDRMEGLVEWFDEQKILDAESPILKAGSKNTIDPDRSLSYWISVRVGDGYNCANVRDNMLTLFPELQ